MKRIPGPHLSDDRLLDHVLGLAAAEDHLEQCAECRRRWRAIESRRGEIARIPCATPEFFERQRRAVWRRIDGHGPRSVPERMLRVAWAPAVVAAALWMAVVGWERPVPGGEPAVQVAAHSGELLEAAWFEETYSILEDHAPRAASPIRHLFDEGISGE